jgi:GNAT superfamily N-acetyltransferase
VLTGYEVVVADVGDRLAGFAALDAEMLAHLYVHPDFQRRGIGDALLARVRKIRPDGFRLWVFQRNTGQRERCTRDDRDGERGRSDGMAIIVTVGERRISRYPRSHLRPYEVIRAAGRRSRATDGCVSRMRQVRRL